MVEAEKTDGENRHDISNIAANKEKSLLSVSIVDPPKVSTNVSNIFKSANFSDKLEQYN